MRVKICGIRSENAIDAAVHGGADAVGFVFSPSPRCVTIEQARSLIASVPAFVTTVAVFRHPSHTEVRDVLEALHPHVVQAEPSDELAGHVEGRATFLPVFHDHADVVEEIQRYYVQHHATVLLEGVGQGGRGVPPDWTRAAEAAAAAPVILAGGLDVNNVLDAISQVRPAGVDVSSGVESVQGTKDPDLIRQFLATIRPADQLEPAE